MKPVVIVGKGPSCHYVPASRHYAVAALNGALEACQYADWLFVNDVSAWGEVEPFLLKAGHVVVPTHLHRTTDGKKTRHYRDVVGSREVETYVLPSAPHSPLGTFGKVLSVGETAVAYLLREGFREFRTVGIDPNGGYHDRFRGMAQVTKKHGSWYRRNWRRIRNRIQNAGGRVKRWDV